MGCHPRQAESDCELKLLPRPWVSSHGKIWRRTRLQDSFPAITPRGSVGFRKLKRQAPLQFLPRAGAIGAAATKMPRVILRFDLRGACSHLKARWLSSFRRLRSGCRALSRHPSHRPGQPYRSAEADVLGSRAERPAWRAQGSQRAPLVGLGS